MLYTYWDDSARTGQFADEGKKEAIRGDIACEVLDVENVYFGDPTLDDVQDQPYILIVGRETVEKLDGKVTALEEKPAKRVDSLVDKIIWAVCAAVITFLLARIGL